jgi:hypothetical protein
MNYELLLVELLADPISRSSIAVAVRLLLWLLSRPAIPATCGVAIDVPFKVSYPPPGTAE